MKNNDWRKKNHFCLYTPGLRLLDRPVTAAPRRKESKAQRRCVTCPLCPNLRQALCSLLSAACSLFLQFGCHHGGLGASLVAQLVKNPSAMRFDLWVGKIPFRRERLSTPVFWPREFMDYTVHGVAKSQT